jgi:D-threo-aldose 1-dehydrogenase
MGSPIMTLPPLPAIGLGTAPLGGLYDLIPLEQAIATVHAALDSGITLIDTAPHYGAGIAEDRLGIALTGVPRDRYVLATKVGRLVDDATRTTRFDFSRDGVLRSVEASLERLRVDRIDLLHVHDPDEHLDHALATAFPALERLRDEGMISGIGVGTNHWEVALRCVERADLDCLLLAGRYTLLEQAGSLDRLFPACEAAGVRVILGGVYNTGILATGAVPGARYNYAVATGEVVDRVRAIEAICVEGGIPIGDAAVQFALAPPVVSSVVLGMRSPLEVAAARRARDVAIPAAVWANLRAADLIAPSAPTPLPVP